MARKINTLKDNRKVDNVKITSTLSPKVQKLLGAITLPVNFDYKKELATALIEKYNGYRERVCKT